MLPNGERNATGDTYIIQSATRHDAGLYICTAYNNVGQPAESTITVNILCEYNFNNWTFRKLKLSTASVVYEMKTKLKTKQIISFRPLYLRA